MKNVKELSKEELNEVFGGCVPPSSDSFDPVKTPIEKLKDKIIIMPEPINWV
jgi:hypothetical protein